MVPWDPRGSVQLTTEDGEPYAYPPSLIAERTRQQTAEWRTDVPLIGRLYRKSISDILVYLSGLGREPKLEGWQDDRHWIRRAWTMQETVRLPVEGSKGGAHEGSKFLGFEESDGLSRLYGTCVSPTVHYCQVS